MDDTSENKRSKHKTYISAGLLAHVDAGKTTLSEALLYTGGAIRKMGRVDRGDAFLDTFELERARGITIFSKQAVLQTEQAVFTLLDTPGHVDFSAEMERTLQVLDYGILVVSGADGVQGHTRTLWRLLQQYRIPVFLFVNKMDQPGTDRGLLLKEIQTELNGNCVDFTERDTEEFYENCAVCEEHALEYFLEHGRLETDRLRELIAERSIFPCFFGSALKMTGIGEFLEGLEQYTREPDYPDEFGAKIFKIARDSQGNRLTWLKITGGNLPVRTPLTDKQEKVSQIRLYSGEKYETVQEGEAGMVCAVTGLGDTRPGTGLGIEADAPLPLLAPVLTYQMILPPGWDAAAMLPKLYQLQEEEPELHIVWDERLQEIQVQIMGEVQLEILKSLVKERFGADISFGAGKILYKETIARPVEGVGHYEPLRHYAEVHLLLEPGEPGSGLVFDACCSEDVLDRNWQRLILTHLEEKTHLGVLTGSPITDMQITLAAGKSHVKHTEGGDFRQATYRALRQGLCRAGSVLLEPVYEFRMELPASLVGRAMTDVQAMSGRFDAPETFGEEAHLTGTVPVSEFGGYQTKMLSYSGGKGRLFTRLKGYEPCHNAEEVIERIGYEAEHDTDNPCGSVFCAHGAGFVVEWDLVEAYMHLEPVLKPGWRLSDGSLYGADHESDQKGQYSKCRQGGGAGDNEAGNGAGAGNFAERYAKRSADGRSTVDFIGQDEVEEIFARTFGTKEPKKQGWARTIRAKTAPPAEVEYHGSQNGQEEYLLVDGYNIIFAWDGLSDLAGADLNAARCRLTDILCNYQAFRKMHLILVFDAYRVKGNPGSVERHHNIDVVYTKEAETADQYIEKVTHEMSRKNHRVRVATSDGLEQIIIMGAGAIRVSARELLEEIRAAEAEMRDWLT